MLGPALGLARVRGWGRVERPRCQLPRPAAGLGHCPQEPQVEAAWGWAACSLRVLKPGATAGQGPLCLHSAAARSPDRRPLVASAHWLRPHSSQRPRTSLRSHTQSHLPPCVPPVMGRPRVTLTGGCPVTRVMTGRPAGSGPGRRRGLPHSRGGPAWKGVPGRRQQQAGEEADPGVGPGTSGQGRTPIRSEASRSLRCCGGT